LISRRISVDLPEPVEPTRNTNSPRRTEKVMSRTPASPGGYVFVTSRKSTTFAGCPGVEAGSAAAARRAAVSACIVAMGLAGG
jgi:hypothetical protein